MGLRDLFRGSRKKKEPIEKAPAPRALHSMEDPPEPPAPRNAPPPDVGSEFEVAEDASGEKVWVHKAPAGENEAISEEPIELSDWPGAEAQPIPEDADEAWPEFEKEPSPGETAEAAEDIPEAGASGGWGAPAEGAEDIPEAGGDGGWGAPAEGAEDVPEAGEDGGWGAPTEGEAPPEAAAEPEEPEDGKKGKKKKEKKKKEKKPKKKKRKKGEEDEEGGEGKKKPKLLLIIIPAVVVVAAAAVLLILKPWAKKDPPPEEDTEIEEPTEGEPTGEEPVEGEEPAEVDPTPAQPAAPRSEPLNTAEALDYFGSLSPAALGLEGEDMDQYRWYTTGASVPIDGMHCMEIMVYRENASAGTNDFVGKFYLSKGSARKLFRMNEDGTVEELSLSTIGLSD